MEVTAALYYPHTTIRSSGLLNNSLLLWDYVECIVPNRRFTQQVENKEQAEAADLVVRHRIPSRQEKEMIHERLQEVLADGLPSWLRQDAKPSMLRGPYLMYPDKLATETWRMLEYAHLAEFDSRSGDFAVPPALGLFAMSLLANECAGTTRTKITDRDRAYAWLIGVMTQSLGGEYIAGLDATKLATTYDRLITASVKIVGTDRIPMRRLIELRKRENAGKAPELRPLRAKYLRSLDEYVKQLLSPSLNDTDAMEIERQFVAAMESDFRELKRELRFGAKEALLSKEIGVAAVALAGAAATPLLSPFLGPAAPAAISVTTSLKSVGVGALYMTDAKYKKARRKALADRAMSWLYVASKRRWL